MAEFLDELADAVKPVEDSLDADIITLSGGIYPPSDEDIVSFCGIKGRPNVLLILTTRGGSPDTAYRIARSLQGTYGNGKFIVYVHWNCKSAGTLITLGCDELIMSPIAHLGPLDIQVERPEEIGRIQVRIDGSSGAINP
jgi:membrane-bound ClpP family serine protease